MNASSEWPGLIANVNVHWSKWTAILLKSKSLNVLKDNRYRERPPCFDIFCRNRAF